MKTNNKYIKVKNIVKRYKYISEYYYSEQTNKTNSVKINIISQLLLLPSSIKFE